jgi:hypothetical protein
MSTFYKTVDDNGVIVEIHKFVAHTFQINDAEDPDIAAGSFLYNWEKSESGKFIMENAYETPSWHRQQSPEFYGWNYIIVVLMEEKKLSEYYLKWGNKIK